MTNKIKIVHSEDVPWQEIKRDGTLLFRRRALAQAGGGKDIGTSYYVVEPGKALFLYHYHTANEEAIFVLGGEGKIRLPDGEHPLGAGDYVALPAGPHSAHQVWAGDDAPLRLLVISTMIDPEIVGYPDSGKIGAFAGSAPGAPRENRDIDLYLKTDEPVDYWWGEPPVEEE